MKEWVKVTREEYEAALEAYPRPLERNTNIINEPPLIEHYDWTLGEGSAGLVFMREWEYPALSRCYEVPNFWMLKWKSLKKN